MRLTIRGALLCLLAGLLTAGPAFSDPYVTPAGAHRWYSASGIRFNDVGGIRFNDVGGIRFNDVGGIRFNDVGGVVFSDSSGIRFNDVGGIRFNDVGGIRFNDVGGGPAIDLELLGALSFLPDSSAINVIITFHAAPTPQDFGDLAAIGITGGTIFRALPMVVVTATRSQIEMVAQLPSVRSVWSDRTLTWVTSESLPFIGVQQAESDPDLITPQGTPLTGQGVTIAIVDTGVDGTHPDLPFGSKLLQNVRLDGAVGTPGAYVHPAFTEGVANTDLILGHGTFVAGIAAGTGQASGGFYRGVATGASLVGLSVGDVYIVNVLEAFDWILLNQEAYGIRIVNCSFATSGPFDPDDPINIGTRLLHDAGLSVVVAAGNYGPAPGTLSPFAVAPWVIGVASGDKEGGLSEFSSRGVFNEGLYHPTLTAPGESIVSTSALSVQGVLGVSGAPAGTDAGIQPMYLGYYTEASGTSFAAPHVAGVIALMLEAEPSLQPDQIKRILQESATPMVSRDRSEVGAGYLDAWAAITASTDPSRGFGSLIPEMLDERIFGYLFGPEVAFSGIVPAGGTATVALDVGPSTTLMQAAISWGSPAADLDLVIRDGSGSEKARSGSVNALGIFGLTEGVTLYRPGASSLTAEITAKIALPSETPFNGQLQTVEPILSLYPDLESLPAADRDVAVNALATLTMTGRNGNCFCGDMKIRRGAAARLLALAAQLPQTIPAAPSFTDVAPTAPEFAYVESVANQAARRGVVLPPKKPWLFGLTNDISRIEFAVAAVNAIGLQDEAAAAALQPVGVADESSLPVGTRGHAALALSLGILTTTPGPQGDLLRPLDAMTRMEAAWAVGAMQEHLR